MIIQQEDEWFSDEEEKSTEVKSAANKALVDYQDSDSDGEIEKVSPSKDQTQTAASSGKSFYSLKTRDI